MSNPSNGRRRNHLELVALVGSVRPGNLTSMALELCIDEARHHHAVARVDAIDPKSLDLQLPGLEPDADRLAPVIERVKGCDGILLSTPEYHGSFSSTIKLLIDNLGFPSALAGKPIAMLGVAAGQIGAIKALEHLRSVCSHVGAIVLPSPVSVAGARSVFDEQGRCLDAAMEKRIRALSNKLVDYLLDTTCPDEPLETTVRGSETPSP